MDKDLFAVRAVDVNSRSPVHRRRHRTGRRTREGGTGGGEVGSRQRNLEFIVKL